MGGFISAHEHNVTTKHIQASKQHSLKGASRQLLHCWIKNKLKMTNFGGFCAYKNCLQYISSYLSVRSSVWTLRVASIKSMVAMFAANDRLQMPTDTPSSRLLHSRYHWYIMLPFNKDLKRAIVRISCKYFSQMISFYQHRAVCLHNHAHQNINSQRQE